MASKESHDERNFVDQIWKSHFALANNLSEQSADDEPDEVKFTTLRVDTFTLRCKV